MSTRAMRERDFDAARPFVDWMVYVPRSVETVPPPGHLEPLNGLGSIIVVQPDPQSVMRPGSCHVFVEWKAFWLTETLWRQNLAVAVATSPVA
jgi:hypothetical protein